MKIRIYHEHCTLKGQEVLGQRAEHADLTGEESDDWFLLDGTPEELLELADLREKNARSGGGGTYDRQVARTIREAVYLADPSLEPKDTDEEN